MGVAMARTKRRSSRNFAESWRKLSTFTIKKERLCHRLPLAVILRTPCSKSHNRFYKVALLRWGLVPYWAKDEKVGYMMINARAETIFTKPAYKSAAERHRCLIPASCFFEWKRKI
jgi:putative SOS response-associated peptidase YedK